MPKQFWLVKQEPEAYSWEQFASEGSTAWKGVRNFAARNNLRAMKRGDVVFYYHSGDEKQIIGFAKVAKENFPDPTADEGDWSAVELKAIKPVKQPLTLQQIKADNNLREMQLVRQSRLSVCPVTPEQAAEIFKLTNTPEPK